MLIGYLLTLVNTFAVFICDALLSIFTCAAALLFITETAASHAVMTVEKSSVVCTTCGLLELWFFVRIDPIHFLAKCRKRQLSQRRSYTFISTSGYELSSLQCQTLPTRSRSLLW